MELNHLPIIDWDLGNKLAGNKPDLAQDMLRLFIRHISRDINNLHNLFKERNNEELLRQVHKLHGALCYCGLPRLKAITGRLETDLKKNIMTNLPSLLQQLETEVALLLDHYSNETSVTA